jgi:hypothetical protein
VIPSPVRLPSKTVAKGWQTLIQNRLNIAWLPSGHVYLRVIHLPAASPDELPGMLELQLEKVSPLPVNQVVWSYEVLPSSDPQTQSIVLLIAQRSKVEAFLGELESQGYLADRLELPALHLLSAVPPMSNGVWLYLYPDHQETTALVAWYSNGQIQQVNLLQLPSDRPDAARILVQRLSWMAWGGQWEGWIAQKPEWHLIAPGEELADWENQLKDYFTSFPATHPAPGSNDLAQVAARRGTRHESRANLLDSDHAARYRQLFFDRIWMQSIAALLVAYILYVAGYAGAVKYYGHRNGRIAREVRALAPAYTNAIVLKDRLRIFQEQVALKYAALDCWRIASELLPAEVTLENLNFKGGEHLHLAGTVPASSQNKVTEFNAQLRKVKVDKAELFDAGGVEAPRFSPRGPDVQRWEFNAKLKSTWLE